MSKECSENQKKLATESKWKQRQGLHSNNEETDPVNSCVKESTWSNLKMVFSWAFYKGFSKYMSMLK